jgi:hypothetical protein
VGALTRNSGYRTLVGAARASLREKQKRYLKPLLPMQSGGSDPVAAKTVSA